MGVRGAERRRRFENRVIEGVSATEVKKQKKCFKLCFEFSNGEVIGALNKGRFRTVGCGGGNE